MLFFYSICSTHSHLASLKKIAQEQQFSDYQSIRINPPIWFLDTIKNSHILGIYVQIDRA